MNGAEAILLALSENGLDVCFANPGTSEMQMVAAFDRVPQVRPVLCLFEGVATGAADGFGRIAGRPAATLLHLGPGLANGVANLHNARRARTPIVNLVGEHATFHRAYDAPLTSDIESLAGTFSSWVRTATSADDAVALAAQAVAASFGPPGGSATLILPADATWSPAAAPAAGKLQPAARSRADGGLIEAAAKKIRSSERPVILLGTEAVGERSLAAAGRLAAAGVRVMVDSFVARLPRGEGRFAPERMPYFGETARAALEGVDLMVTVHSKPPVAFFGYPKRPSAFLPDGCETLSAAQAQDDAAEVLEGLAAALGANAPAETAAFAPPPPSQKFNPHSMGGVIARLMPADTIVSEDAATSGVPIMNQTATARRHDWLFLTGGAIGQALPVALGAATAAPDRKVIALSGDGAGAYTPQALWSIAREGLDVTAIVFANHAYRILNIELERTEAGEAGERARRLLDLEDPRIDWAGLGRALGVPSTKVQDMDGFEAAFARAMQTRGPHLIEVVLAPQ